MQKTKNNGFIIVGDCMNLNWLYKAVLTIIITITILLIIDTIGISNPVSESINEIEGLFYI